MPHIELSALEHLDALGGLTPGELGHRLGLTSGGVTALTGRLIDAGYVTRERHPEDGRMRMLTVTPAGAERLREHIEPVLEPLEEALARLSGAEAELADPRARRAGRRAARRPPRRRRARSASTRPTATRARS